MAIKNCTGWASLRALFLTIAMSLSVASVFAQSSTFARTDYPFIGQQVVGDFNGDGRPDLAGQAYLVQAVTVRLNNGNGTFGAVVNYPLPAWPQDVAVGDFNGDFRLDLVVTYNDPQISVSLLTGNADGTFNAPVTFPNTSGFDSPAIIAADLNNDGRLDIVIGHQLACFTICIGSKTITVMLGNGNGTFLPANEINIGIETAEIAAGDFNRDGFKDLAIASSLARVSILLGVGDGTFNQQPTLTLIPAPNLGMDATDIDVADFNRDGIEDLVVALALNGSKTAILIGIGNSTFQAPLLITDPNINIPHRQAVADYNGDGFLDLALSMADGNQGLMNIRNGNGDGTFQAPVVYLTPPPLSSAGGAEIVSADLNGDGKADIVLGQSGAFPGLLVLINSTGVTPPATPVAPTLISPAADATPAQPVSFDWNDVANATSYEAQVDDSSTISAPFIASQIVNVSQASIGGLPAQRLWWRVRARNSAGVFGPFSATRRFTPQASTSVPALSAIALSAASVVGGNTVQGTATLTSTAPAGGALVTLSSSNLSVATVPASATVAAGALSAPFTVSTVSVTASTLATITAAFGGATRSATLSVTPLAAPPPPVGPASLFVSPATVEGGANATGTIFLTLGAPAGGLVVSLTSSNTAAATVPATTTVLLSSGTFPISTLVAATTRTTTITASANGISQTATLTVNGSAAPPPAALSALSLSPATVQGGNSSTGTVTLSAAAPTGGAVVSLSSSTAAATVPASVSVAPGATSTTFPIATSAVTTSTLVTITASAGGVTRTAALTVNPPSANVTLTVTATGRSGERVISSPVGINVSVGSSGSASFAAGTAITLSATNGRDVVWSGACSSGGNKTETCTFTLSANASVSANVQ